MFLCKALGFIKDTEDEKANQMENQLESRTINDLIKDMDQDKSKDKDNSRQSIGQTLEMLSMIVDAKENNGSSELTAEALLMLEKLDEDQIKALMEQRRREREKENQIKDNNSNQKFEWVDKKATYF